MTENVITDLNDACALQIEAAGGAVEHLVVANNLLQRIGRTAVSITSNTQPLQFIQVHHNEITDCLGRAIWVKGSYNTIESNVIVNSAYAGIWQENGVGNRYRLNRLFDCGGAAVEGHPPDKPLELQDSQDYNLNEVNYIHKPIPGGSGTN